MAENFNEKYLDTDGKPITTIFSGSGNTRNKNFVTRIIFATDIHYGEISDRVDNKTDYIMPTEDDISLLMHAIAELEPDYIVFGGDYIHYPFQAKLEDCRKVEVFEKFITKMLMDSDDLTEDSDKYCRYVIKDLFDSKRVIMIPGNHDIEAGDNQMLLCKFDGKHRLNNCIMPPVSTPEGNGSMSAYDFRVLAKRLLDKHKDKKPEGTASLPGKLPFVIDFDKKVIIYAFNSNTYLQAKQQKKEETECPKEQTETKTDSAIPQICQQDLNNFEYFCGLLKELLKNNYDSYLFMVALHHHTSDIADFHELKEFGGISNSGVFKKILNKHGVKLILHGHKHWPEVYIDAAVSEGGTIATVSGGTICTQTEKTATGVRPGFHIIDYDRRHYHTARIGYQELNAQGIQKFPYIQLRTKSEFFKYKRKSLDTQEMIYFPIQKALLKELGRRGRQNNGWSLHLSFKAGKEHKLWTSTCATAIGLCIMELTNCRFQEYLDAKATLIESLREPHDEIVSKTHDCGRDSFMRCEYYLTGARKFGGFSIEETCWVARAFYILGDTKNLKMAINGVLKLYSLHKVDLYSTAFGKQQYKNNVYTLSLLLDVFTAYMHFIGSKSDSDELYTDVSEAAREIYITLMGKKMGADSFCYWGDRLNRSNNRGSLVHTAYVLIACKNYYSELKLIGKEKELNEKQNIETCLHGIKEWLFEQFEIMEQKSTDRLEIPDAEETIVSFLTECDVGDVIRRSTTKKPRIYRHTTVALFIRALLYCNVPASADIIYKLIEVLYNRLDLPENNTGISVSEPVSSDNPDEQENTGLMKELTTNKVKYIFRTYDAVIALEDIKNSSFTILLE